MKSLLKIFLGLIVLLIVVPLIAIIVITQLVNPNDYKADIEQLAATHTRGQLTLEGDLGWSFFPTLGFTTGALQFRLPEDTQSPFAQLKGATVGVQLLPLFRGDVAADAIIIDGLALNLAADKQGTGNWTRITRETAKPESSKASGAEAGGAAMAIAIDRIALTNASIHYRDADNTHQLAIHELALSQVNLSGEPLQLAFSADLQSSALGDNTLPLRINSSISLDANGDRIQLNGMNASIANLNAQGNLVIEIQPALQVSGTLDIPAFDAQALMKALGQTVPAFQDPNVLRRVALNATFSGPANSIIMNPLVITLDDTTLKGQAGISNLDNNHLLIELQGNALNADRYQTASAEADGSSTKPESANNNAETNTALLPLATLREQNFKLKLGLDALVANQLKLEQVAVAAHGADGVIILDALNANLYGGTVKANASIDARSDNPLIKASKKLSDVQLGPLLKDMQGSEPFSGTASIEVDINTRGNTLPQLKSNLNGPIGIVVKNGVLHGVSLERYTCQAIATTRKKQTTAQWPADSAIDRISMNLLFKNGVGVTQDIKGKLPQLRILGDGVVSLPTDQFDMRIGVALTGDLSGTDPACEVNETYRDIAWPLRCKGTYAGENAKTDCGLDSTRMNELLQKIAKKEAASSLDKKAEEKLGDDWKAIKGLLGK